MIDSQEAPLLAQDSTPTSSLSDARERSLNEDLFQLAQEARTYAESEFAYQKARVAYVAGATKSIVVFAIAAAVLVFFALMALVVGLVIALAPLITAWGSTAVVTLVLLGLAAYLLLKAKKRIGCLMAVLGEDPA